MRIEKLLVPVDFSEGSATAFARALSVAREHGASLHLLHALGTAEEVPPAVHQKDEERATAALEELVQRVGDAGLQADAELFQGPPLDGFEQAEERLRPDLVVIGAHGRPSLRRLWLGSVTTAIVRHAFAPVLVVRGAADAAPSPFSTVLVGTDFSRHAAAAGQAARALAGAGARLHALHVMHVPYEAVAAMGSRVVDRWRQQVNEAVEAAARDLDAEPELREGSPAHEIAQRAQELGCDLVAVGTRGQTGGSPFLPGSVAERVLRLAPCCVLTARGAAAPAELREALRDAGREATEADLPAAERSSLVQDLRELRTLIEDAEEAEDAVVAAGREALAERLAGLEAAHPRLADALSRVIQTLSRMGI